MTWFTVNVWGFVGHWEVILVLRCPVVWPVTDKLMVVRFAGRDVSYEGGSNL